MLDRLFMQILDMSKIGSVVILIVLMARLLLKKCPKVISYALWAVVLLRLLCPVHIEANISIVPEFTPVEETYALTDAPISIAGAGVAAYQAVRDAINGGLGVQHIPTTQKDTQGNIQYVTTDWWDVWILLGQYVWVIGVAVMAVYSVVSYFKLRKQLAVTVHLRDNIYIADDIGSPFVIGLFKPKIYLPGTLGDKEQEYIILHEQYHIRRFDHIIKVLAFLALMLHWFNPLVWLAFILASRDMEMSCDEAVIRKLGAEVRADYSASLLQLATGKRIIAGTPLAFGEGDPKGRIKNLAKWKKPVVWVTVAAIIFCAALALCLLTDQSRKNQNTGVTFYYGTLIETDANGIVIQQADGNLLRFSKADSFSLEAGVETGSYVAMRCNTGAGTSASRIEGVERICGTSLDKVVDAAIKQVNDSKWHEGQFVCTDFALVNKETQIGKYETLYGLALHQVYSARNGMYREVSGSHIPVAIKLVLINPGEYVLAEYWQPRDGAYYGDDLRAKFGMIPDTQDYIDTQLAACRKLADAHFEYLYQQDLEEIKKELEEIRKEAEKATAPRETTAPTVPVEFELASGIPGVVTYTNPLEELGASYYSPQQAAADGCVVMIGGDVWANEYIWTAFTVAYSRGEKAGVRLTEYTAEGEIIRIYEIQGYVKGYVYRLLENGTVTERAFRYLALDGDGDCEGENYNMFWVYALTNNAMWKFEKGVPYDDSTWQSDAVMGFCNLYVRYDYAPIPDSLRCAEITHDGETLAVVWDQQKLREIYEFLATAEGEKGWPKTAERGAKLILTGTDGVKIEAVMLMNAPMIEIDGVFYNYDPGWKEEKTVEDLLNLFGISQLPE